MPKFEHPASTAFLEHVFGSFTPNLIFFTLLLVAMAMAPSYFIIGSVKGLDDDQSKRLFRYSFIIHVWTVLVSYLIVNTGRALPNVGEYWVNIVFFMGLVATLGWFLAGFMSMFLAAVFKLDYSKSSTNIIVLTSATGVSSVLSFIDLWWRYFVTYIYQAS